MADGLNLSVALLLREVEHTIDGCRGRGRERVVVQAVETILGSQRVGLVRDGVPLILLTLEIPLLVVVERGREVDVVQDVERSRDGYRMFHAVLHVVERLARENLILGGGYRVGQLTRVLHRNLLIPAVLAHLLLAFEGVDARHIEDHRRQRNRDTLVLRVLRNGHVCREREGGTGPILRERNRRVGLRRENIVQVGGRVLVVAARGEVYRGRPIDSASFSV